VVLAVGTRLADFATGSWALFENPNFKLVSLNVTHFDVGKHRGLPLALMPTLGDALTPRRR
jgi:3D-(3,5/4)-trihydroxycyclohexane-1,2-dione acylhydrolase (decyclizing)